MNSFREDIHTFTYTVEEKYNNLTIKEYLSAQAFSSALLIKIKQTGKVWLNEEEKRLFQNVYTGDKLVVDIGKEKLDILGEDIPVKIIYENKDLLIVNKDPFLVTHPSKRYPSGTLANAIAHYLKLKKVDTKIRFVNRLDRNTSGIIIISKNLYAHNYVQTQIKERTTKKVYWAVVSGIIAKKIGIINAPIERISETSITRHISPEGQEAITSYKVLEEYGKFSLVELHPKTGRTHQLRVHMQYIGHPIVGDDLYNNETSIYINRQALHAKEMEFVLPRENKKIKLVSELSEDIKNLINRINS